jgi:hypothetical protein
MIFSKIAAALTAGCLLVSAAPAVAVDGEILITQAKALQGSITPNDTAGFPITISRAGVYKLAGNLTPPENKAGFQVTAANVTIDFDGFQLLGGGVANRGVVGSQSGLTLLDGTIEAFRLEGVLSTSTQSLYWTLTNMRIVRNAGDGFNTNSDFARVEKSTLANNGGQGIQCENGCHVEGSIIAQNGADGINIANGTVLGNTIVANEGFGIHSFGGTGFGNNTLRLNNSNGAQTADVIAMQPNFCAPSC